MPSRSQRHLREIRGVDSAGKADDGSGFPQAPDKVGFGPDINDIVHDDASNPFSYDAGAHFTGNDTPLAFTVQAGSLPTGLTLAGATGVISGSPTAPLSESGIVIRCTDNSGDTADSNAFSIEIV